MRCGWLCRCLCVLRGLIRYGLCLCFCSCMFPQLPKASPGSKICGNIELWEHRAVGLYSCGNIELGLYSCGSIELLEYTAAETFTRGTRQLWEHRALGLYSCGNTEVLQYTAVGT